MLAVNLELPRHFAMHGIGIADDVRMANGGMELLQHAIVAHPIGDDLAQPAHPLGTEIELPGHVAALLGMFGIEAAATAEIRRPLGGQRRPRTAASAQHAVGEEE